MDKWKYYAITHDRHLLCNPMNTQKFERLCHLLRLPSTAHVLDIACGKGELLVRLAELYNITGIGIDLSSYCIHDCRVKHQQRVPAADLTFLEMDGADYEPASPRSFDVAMCIGASWIYDGYRGTIQALKRMVKADGLILVGEPYWLKTPSDEYLTSEGITQEDFDSHWGNVQVGEAEGLTCLYTLLSNSDDWDHYETLQWWAADDYARSHPDDPDVHEVNDRKQREKAIYLRGGRETMGWAIYIFRNGSQLETGALNSGG